MVVSKKEYRGTLYLLAIAIGLILANQVVHHFYFSTFPKELPKDETAYLDSLLGLLEAGDTVPNYARNRNKHSINKDTIPLNLHLFDPNKVEREEWLAMGLPERVFNSFEKYRSKGGKIRKPEQILKLYNLDPELGQKMIPFIQLDSSQLYQPKFQFADEKKPFEKKEKVLFDLNQADTLQLMSVFGIGRGIANRIVRYRDNLGGFHSRSQVYEVFALDSLVVDELLTRSFLPENPVIHHLQINKATEEELGKHPYIRKSLARYIFKYRQQHGDYKKPEDLLEIKVMNPEVVEKLRPYLAF